MLNKTKLASIVLGAAFLFGSTGIMKAEHWNEGKCRARIRKEERELQRAEWRFGPWSRKAQEERFELNRIRNRCYYNDDYEFRHH